MKKIPQLLLALLSIFIVLLAARRSSAQVLPAILTVQATDPIASESGDTATFTITRTGPTNNFLTFFCAMGGTAKMGLDYGSISPNLTIAPGRRTTTVVINPIQDALVEGTETVEFHLLPSQLMSPGAVPGYILGSASNAVAYIFDDDGTNAPAVVKIISPTEGAAFYAPTNVPIFAKTLSLQNNVTNVEFFAGTQDLGPGNMLVLDPPGVNGVTGPVYYFNWTNPSIGNYSLTAVATDDGGNSATSAPVAISVLPPPPVVKITTPTNGATFVAPLNIPISATASSSNADVVRVQFYADDHFIGADFGLNKAHYDLTWTNPAPGFYALRAVAVDSFGGKGSSDVVPVIITGTNTPPPLPVVTIYALDPLAVVGTNCLSVYATPTPFVTNGFFRPRTNTASFVVHRSGATTGSLDVYYSTSGTASNGVDYAPLPGVVTIPAGLSVAKIVIYPLAENVPDCPEKVILSVTNGPSYNVGWPDRAAALIVDCSAAPPPTALLCDGAFHFYLPPSTNAPYYRIECSSDMIHWIPVCTNTASELGIHFVDPQLPGLPNLFYRTVPQANAPLDVP